jgi:hypothetical protein
MNFPTRQKRVAYQPLPYHALAKAMKNEQDKLFSEKQVLPTKKVRLQLWTYQIDERISLERTFVD